MLAAYMEGGYDLTKSFVIGDRMTDIELARNLGAKAILIGEPDQQQKIDEAGLISHCSYIAGDWSAVYAYLLRNRRRAHIVRKTQH
jgi:imidazoleglycerol-phosphate dehydratase/histidinol-phosphatase